MPPAGVSVQQQNAMPGYKDMKDLSLTVLVTVDGCSIQEHNVLKKPPPFAVQLDHTEHVPVQELVVFAGVVVVEGFVVVDLVVVFDVVLAVVEVDLVVEVLVVETALRLRFAVTVTVIAGIG